MTSNGTYDASGMVERLGVAVFIIMVIAYFMIWHFWPWWKTTAEKKLDQEWKRLAESSAERIASIEQIGTTREATMKMVTDILAQSATERKEDREEHRKDRAEDKALMQAMVREIREAISESATETRIGNGLVLGGFEALGYGRHELTKRASEISGEKINADRYKTKHDFGENKTPTGTPHA